MSGGVLRSGGRRAAEILLRHSRAAPFADSIPQQWRAYVRPSHLRSSKYKDTPHSSSPHFSAATAAAAASAAAASSSSAARNGFVSWYLGMIEARPVLTKSLTAAAIFTAADVSSQMITLTSPDSLDLIRTLRMAGYGMLISGPTLHLWFNFLSRILPRRDVLNTLKKMLLGQATYGPLMTAVFFSVNAGLQGESDYAIIARLKRDMLPTLINSLLYWPICDFITFKFAPVRLQPLINNSFAFLWTIYITYIASLQKASVERIGAADQLHE